jgi:hypothetical protein
MVLRILLSQMQFLQEQMPEKVRKLVDLDRSCRALLPYIPCTIPLPCLSELGFTVPNGWVQRVTHFILQAMDMALHSISLCGCCCLLLPASYISLYISKLSSSNAFMNLPAEENGEHIVSLKSWDVELTAWSVCCSHGFRLWLNIPVDDALKRSFQVNKYCPLN